MPEPRLIGRAASIQVPNGGRGFGRLRTLSAAAEECSIVGDEFAGDSAAIKARFEWKVPEGK